jgi:hypothetical protein
MDEMPLLLSCYEVETVLRQKGGSMVSRITRHVPYLLILSLCVSIGECAACSHPIISARIQWQILYFTTIFLIQKL